MLYLINPILRLPARISRQFHLIIVLRSYSPGESCFTRYCYYRQIRTDNKYRSQLRTKKATNSSRSPSYRPSTSEKYLLHASPIGVPSPSRGIPPLPQRCSRNPYIFPIVTKYNILLRLVPLFQLFIDYLLMKPSTNPKRLIIEENAFDPPVFPRLLAQNCPDLSSKFVFHLIPTSRSLQHSCLPFLHEKYRRVKHF